MGEGLTRAVRNDQAPERLILVEAKFVKNEQRNGDESELARQVLKSSLSDGERPGTFSMTMTRRCRPHEGSQRCSLMAPKSVEPRFPRDEDKEDMVS